MIPEDVIQTPDEATLAHLGNPITDVQCLTLSEAEKCRRLVGKSAKVEAE